MILIEDSTHESVLIIGLHQESSGTGRILIPLVISKNWRNPCWRIPGGGVHVEEKPEEAAKRELLEETGLSVEEPLLAMTILKNSRMEKSKHRQFVYTTEILSIEKILEHSHDGDEELSIRLFDICEIISYLYKGEAFDEYRMLSIHENIMREVLRKLDFCR